MRAFAADRAMRDAPPGLPCSARWAISALVELVPAPAHGSPGDEKNPGPLRVEAHQGEGILHVRRLRGGVCPGQRGYPAC